MKKWFCFSLAALVLTGCAPAHMVSAEIPMEILGELDEATRQELTEEPKYVALTFDDGPRADTTGRLLDGLLDGGGPPDWQPHLFPCPPAGCGQELCCGGNP